MSEFEMGNLSAISGGRWDWASKRLDPAEHDLQPLLGFFDRDSYLAWVASWKSAFKDTVADIRTERAEGCRSRRESLRVQAHNLLVVRRAAKTEAAAQWQARRAPEVAA